MTEQRTLLALQSRTLGRYWLYVTVEWKLADLWTGMFWRRGRKSVEVWVCLLPCLPVHIWIVRMR